MQSLRLRQVLHNQILAPSPRRIALCDQVARVRFVLQDVHSGPVPEGAHLHPHAAEAFQVRLRWVHARLPPSRQAIHAPQSPPEYHLLNPASQA